MLRLFVCLLSVLLSSCATYRNPPRTVSHVNLKRYMGTWYEIASFPNVFQRGCQCTTATYALHGKNAVSVLNRCYKGDSLKLSEAKGRAWSVSSKNNKLKVQFFWPFSGDYWILYLTPGYNQVIVGSPDRKYLWILSRTRKITKQKYKQLLTIAKSDGFDISYLVKTKQSCTKN